MLVEIDDDVYGLVLKKAAQCNETISDMIMYSITHSPKNTKINHHTKYKEIDGVDELIEMRVSEHIKFHRKLAKNGNKIPLDICVRAGNRRQFKDNYSFIDLSENVAPYISLFERLRINKKTGNINFQSYFHSERGLKYIDIIDNELQSSQMIAVNKIWN